MAGTNKSRTQSKQSAGAPAIILVEPQLGENIGTAARAMLNFGLTEMRLVNPRDGWPNPRAVGAASGADMVIEGARVFPDAAAASADIDILFATTARPRDMIKRVVTPTQATAEMRVQAAGGKRCGILFGRERWGLTNDEVVLADTVVTIPSNPAFASFNIAMAVLLIGYEWYRGADATPPAQVDMGRGRLANKAELLGLFAHLEAELDACGFLRVADKRPSMVRNLRNIFQRAGLSEQEARTLRGVISGLADHAHRRWLAESKPDPAKQGVGEGGEV